MFSCSRKTFLSFVAAVVVVVAVGVFFYSLGNFIWNYLENMIFWKFLYTNQKPTFCICSSHISLSHSLCFFFFSLFPFLAIHCENDSLEMALTFENYSSKNPKKVIQVSSRSIAISMVFWIMFHFLAFILCWLTTKLLSLFITFICNGDDIPFSSVEIHFCHPFCLVPIHIFRFKWFFVAHFNYLHFITIF